MSSDCPRDVSIICAMTVASTMGRWVSKLPHQVPDPPKRNMIHTSNARNRML